LSCPSSLQGHSDFLSARIACLAGFIQLGRRLSPSDRGESRRISGPILRSLSPHAVDLTPGPLPVLLPSSSRQALAFPHNVRGRRVARSRGFVPQSGSPSYSCPIRAHEAASFVFVLRPVVSASTPDWVHGAVSGQVPPRCCHPNAPPAYISQKATDMAGSFHPASKRFRNLIHGENHGRRSRTVDFLVRAGLDFADADLTNS